MKHGRKRGKEETTPISQLSRLFNSLSCRQIKEEEGENPDYVIRRWFKATSLNEEEKYGVHMYNDDGHMAETLWRRRANA
jgi:hypothetical protein